MQQNGDFRKVIRYFCKKTNNSKPKTLHPGSFRSASEDSRKKYPRLLHKYVRTGAIDYDDWRRNHEGMQNIVVINFLTTPPAARDTQHGVGVRGKTLKL